MNTEMDAESNDDPTDATEEQAADAKSTGGEADADDSAHLNSLPDGAGCTEIWEHLSETRGDD